MKKIFLVLATFVAAFFLTACGGGEAPATVTQVEVAPITPVVVTANVTLIGVPVNVKTSTVNVGQRGVNLVAFNVAFSKPSEDTSIQELIFKNTKGGNSYEMFTQWRLADENGDVCPRFSCYVQVNATDIRVLFHHGWRPQEGELKTYSLQADISPTAPNGATFAFELIGVQMRQWGKTIDGKIVGKAMEVTTIVALPVITSSQGRRIVNTTVGMQYEVLNVTVTCYSQIVCNAKEIKMFLENGQNLYVAGSGTLTQLDNRTYVLHPNHSIGQGTTVTWTFFATATDSNMYAQWTDMVFEINGVEFSPINANQSAECIDVASKGGGNCYFGGKG